MDQQSLIILIIVGGLAAFAAIGLYVYQDSTSKRASKRIYSGAAPTWNQQPQQQQGYQQAPPWAAYKGACPPSAQSGCVPAKLVEHADEYIAIRVRANGCGCSAGEIGQQLQTIADMTQAARDAQARTALEQQLLDVLGGTRAKAKAS
jgi:hypothetical protein